MRLTLDTNVLIAAFVAEGLCQRVYSSCLKSHDIVLSKYILAEVERAFLKKAKMSMAQTKGNLQNIRDSAIIVEIPEDVEQVCRDPKDDAILATAMIGDCRMLVTGDEDLLVLKRYRSIRIVSPRTFVETET